MTELFHDAQLRAGVQAIPAIDEADGNVPALLAGSSTLSTTDSRDALGKRESLPLDRRTTALGITSNPARSARWLGPMLRAMRDCGRGHSHHRRRKPTAKLVHCTPKSRE